MWHVMLGPLKGIEEILGVITSQISENLQSTVWCIWITLTALDMWKGHVISFWVFDHLPPLRCMYADIGMTRPRRGNGAGVFAPWQRLRWTGCTKLPYSHQICHLYLDDRGPCLRLNNSIVQNLRCPTLIPVKVTLLTPFFLQVYFFL